MKTFYTHTKNKQTNKHKQLRDLLCGAVVNLVTLLQVPELSKESIKRAPNRNAVAILEKTITIQGKLKTYIVILMNQED